MSVADVDDRLLTPDDVARRLSVSRSMAYALIKRGALPVIYVGRLPRVAPADFEAYLAAASRPATPEQARPR